jgi:succinate-acetate transporter protein
MLFLAFWVWLISLNMMISSSTHFPTNDTMRNMCAGVYIVCWLWFFCVYVQKW